MDDKYDSISENLRKALERIDAMKIQNQLQGIAKFAEIYTERTVMIANAFQDNGTTAMLSNLQNQLQTIKLPTYTAAQIANVSSAYTDGILRLMGTMDFQTQVFENISASIDQLTKSVVISSGQLIGNTSYLVDSINRAFENIDLQGITLKCANILNSIDVSTLSKDLEEEKYNADCITVDSIVEMDNDLSEIFESRNWQQILNDKIMKWSDTNPIFAKLINIVFSFIVCGIVAGVIGSCIYSALIKNDSSVKIEPSKDAAIIQHVYVNQEVTVINNNVAYYYQIEFTDTETGEIKIGYIAKRNVQVLEDEINEEVINDGN